MKKQRVVSRHHRLPRSRGGGNELSNISIVEQKRHCAWHLLVGNMTAPEIASMLTDTWIDAKYYLVAVPRRRPIHKNRRKRRFCLECSAEVLKHIPTTSKKELP